MLLGPIADITRDKLLQDMPDVFAIPSKNSGAIERIGPNRRKIILMITQRKNIKTRSKRGKAGGVPLTVFVLQLIG